MNDYSEQQINKFGRYKTGLEPLQNNVPVTFAQKKEGRKDRKKKS